MKTARMLVILVLALGLTAEVANADFTFGEPTNLGPTVNCAFGDLTPSISTDGISLFFASGRPGGPGAPDLWVTTRDTKDDEWGTPASLGPTVNGSDWDYCPSISADALELYFASDRPGGSGGDDIHVSRRAVTDEPWGTPVNLGSTVNSTAHDYTPTISADGLLLCFNSMRVGGFGEDDIYISTRATTDDPWSAPLNLGLPFNTSSNDSGAKMTADGRMLFFNSTRPRGYGEPDIWVATRASTNESWGEPVNLGPTVNSSYGDLTPSISADGITLFFSSNRPGGLGGYDLWQVSIEPVVDFNGDGIVDSADMCIMVDYWGTDEPFYDIGPTPFGDGIVDVEDLIVLSEYLFEEVNDPTLVAHWALDETEGGLAYDSAGVFDGVLNDVPTWQPTGGAVDGALQFDGIDDYVSTDFVLDPADGPFSVFAWIKGGAAGQVVISQASNAGGENWLSADPLDGKLMTELKGTGRSGFPQISESVITDGDWHRIGLVRDESYRILYVDGAEVAKDTEPQQAHVVPSDGGLYFGAGNSLDAGSFFSGLIDEVRIYNRAITP